MISIGSFFRALLFPRLLCLLPGCFGVGVFILNFGPRVCLSIVNPHGQFPALLTKKLIKMPPNMPSNISPLATNILRFVKLSEKAHAPTKGSIAAAGFDLRSAYEYVVPAHGKELIKTDLQVEVPLGTYGRVAPRSGLAWKSHIDVGAGVIDADYRGNVGVILFNHSNQEFKVAPGDRVAQLICERIVYPELEEVDSLETTERGNGGFGSTGIN